MVKCKKCGETNETNFYGYNKSRCKTCICAAVNKRYKLKKIEDPNFVAKINKQSRERYSARKEDPEFKLRKQKSWRKAQRVQYKKLRSTPYGIEKMHKWSAKARRKPSYLKRLREKHKEKSENDVKYILVRRLRHRLYNAFKAKGIKKSNTTMNLCGCSPDELRKHIENQFSKHPGMSWNNRHMWHIDHILPINSFDITDVEQQKKCFHYTNLQPLWAMDNLLKSDKIIQKIS